MAIEIRAIECPKCGSTEKTEVRLEHFRCDSCGTEYFLDDGNTVKQGANPDSTNPRGTTSADTLFTPPVIYYIFFGVVAAIVLIVSAIGSSYRSHPSATGTDTTTSATTLPTTWQYSTCHVYLSADDKPIIVGEGRLSSYKNNSYKEEPYIFFVDAVTGYMLKKFPIPNGQKDAVTYKFRQFSNDDLYLTADKTTLFLVDKRSFSLEDVTQTFGSRQRELQSGIAQVEFVPSSYEDGFKLMTNNGKYLYYFPLKNKIYKEMGFWEAQKGMKTLPSVSVETTGFTFSFKSTSRDDDTIQLVKYRYLDNRGGPKILPWFRWDDRFHPPLFIFPKDDYRILSYSNFTPGRLYFEPKVLYSDDDYVLISYATAAAGTIRYVQCLSARSAEIVFTTRLDDLNLEEGTVRFQGGFISWYNDIYWIDMNGKVQKIKTSNDLHE